MQKFLMVFKYNIFVIEIITIYAQHDFVTYVWGRWEVSYV